MRVAFTLIGGRDWTGGHNYLLNLFRIMAQHQVDRLTLVLFVAEKCAEVDIAPFAAISGVEVVRTPFLNAARRPGALLQAVLWGRDVNMHGLFREHHIDVVFEAAQFFGWRLGLSSIAWIPDFQHRALPHLFSQWAWWKREIGLRAQVLGGRHIMLSSNDTRRACEIYFPSTCRRTRTVHFAVPPGPEISYAEARAIADDYGLPERFFYMPNQFWKHKNHALVVEALAQLRLRGMRLVVAASGNPSDPRDPDHFLHLQNRVKQLGVGDQIRFLGLIPYSHVAPLLRASIALLNPSLFEGWSTTVEEARALGTPMVLSDLDVHREQMGGHATYFDRNSPSSLADAMQNFQFLDEVRREKLASEARKDAELRVIEFADNFADLVENCMQERRL